MLVLQSRGHMEVMKFLLVKEATAKTGCVVQWEAPIVRPDTRTVGASHVTSQEQHLPLLLHSFGRV